MVIKGMPPASNVYLQSIVTTIVNDRGKISV
jgi:hypothetical protein